MSLRTPLAPHAGALPPATRRARSPSAGLGRWAPALVEAVLAASALVLLLPGFQRLVASSTPSAEGRYADPGWAVEGLPAVVLPALCASHGAIADPAVAQALCKRA